MALPIPTDVPHENALLDGRLSDFLPIKPDPENEAIFQELKSKMMAPRAAKQAMVLTPKQILSYGVAALTTGVGVAIVVIACMWGRYLLGPDTHTGAGKQATRFFEGEDPW